MSSANFDFSYIDHLPQKSADQGRVFFGTAAQKFDRRPAILFVHGGYHGAWCFVSAEYDLLEDAPHCMMLSTNWRDSAALIEAWYRRHF